MLEENKTQTRVERHKVSQEDFTPEEVVKMLYLGSEEAFTDFSKTVLDPCAGICYILVYCLKQRLKHCNSESDIISAVSTLYGTELFEDNVIEGRQNMLNAIFSYIEDNNISLTLKSKDKIKSVLEHNITTSDTFKWNYQEWKSIEEITEEPLF